LEYLERLMYFTSELPCGLCSIKRIATQNDSSE